MQPLSILIIRKTTILIKCRSLANIPYTILFLSPNEILQKSTVPVRYSRVFLFGYHRRAYLREKRGVDLSLFGVLFARALYEIKSRNGDGRGIRSVSRFSFFGLPLKTSIFISVSDHIKTYVLYRAYYIIQYVSCQHRQILFSEILSRKNDPPFSAGHSHEASSRQNAARRVISCS